MVVDGGGEGELSWPPLAKTARVPRPESGAPREGPTEPDEQAEEEIEELDVEEPSPTPPEVEVLDAEEPSPTPPAIDEPDAEKPTSTPPDADEAGTEEPSPAPSGPEELKPASDGAVATAAHDSAKAGLTARSATAKPAAPEKAKVEIVEELTEGELLEDDADEGDEAEDKDDVLEGEEYKSLPPGRRTAKTVPSLSKRSQAVLERATSRLRDQGQGNERDDETQDAGGRRGWMFGGGVLIALVVAVWLLWPPLCQPQSPADTSVSPASTAGRESASEPESSTSLAAAAGGGGSGQAGGGGSAEKAASGGAAGASSGEPVAEEDSDPKRTRPRRARRSPRTRGARPPRSRTTPSPAASCSPAGACTPSDEPPSSIRIYD